MEDRARQRPEALTRSAIGNAVARLREWQREQREQRQQQPPVEEETLSSIRTRLRSDTRVWQVDGVFTDGECVAILRAVDAAARRRGWDRLRHGKHPTTDMPLHELAACETRVRVHAALHVHRGARTP